MNKRFALIALLLAALMLLSGCNLIGHDDELDGAQVVAKVETSQDTTEITKAEWEAYRDYLASYYQQYFQQNFGVSMQLTDDDIASYGEAAVEQLIESVVLEGKMKELGFEPLPEEDAADVESYADSMFNFYKHDDPLPELSGSGDGRGGRSASCRPRRGDRQRGDPGRGR